MKHSFRNDYSELAHENILKALLKEVNNQNIAYGNDVHSDNAKWLIKKTFKCYNAAVYLVSGGTQANMLVISHLLRHYEGVISCDSGHINVHETAAIEGNGNKVYTVKNTNGKLTAEDIKEALRINKGEHMVKLKMVYISNSTEMGTIYTKEELLIMKNNLQNLKVDYTGGSFFTSGSYSQFENKISLNPLYDTSNNSNEYKGTLNHEMHHMASNLGRINNYIICGFEQLRIARGITHIGKGLSEAYTEYLSKNNSKIINAEKNDIV